MDILGKIEEVIVKRPDGSPVTVRIFAAARACGFGACGETVVYQSIPPEKITEEVVGNLAAPALLIDTPSARQ
jgi:hypothetical protein